MRWCSFSGFFHAENNAIPLITLSSDFGLRDSYVAQVKGVLYSLVPDAVLADLSHDIPAHDIRHGARLLAEAVPLFPAQTIHLSVVDPGVGSTRRPIVVSVELPKGGQSVLIGPDNGLFSLAAPPVRRLNVWRILPERLACATALSTFDARDLFAPAAAFIALGRNIKDFTEPVAAHSLVEIEEPAPAAAEPGRITGKVVYIDAFGNAVTNIAADSFAPTSAVQARLRGMPFDFANSYSQIPAGTAALIRNSQGMLEIAANGTSAAGLLQLRIGDEVTVSND